MSCSKNELIEELGDVGPKHSELLWSSLICAERGMTGCCGEQGFTVEVQRVSNRMRDLRTASVLSEVGMRSPVLIGVLQKHTIKQYIRSAKTAELIAPLTEGFSDISRPVVLQICFPKTYQGEIKHIPIW